MLAYLGSKVWLSGQFYIAYILHFQRKGHIYETTLETFYIDAYKLICKHL